MRWLMTVAWTPPRLLAAAAFVLGMFAMAGQPVGGHTVTLDTRELAALIGGRVDHMVPAELAARIIRGDTNYRLIDLREEADFATYHIPGAESVPIEGLLDAGLRRNETIVLYSDGGIHAAQAWMLMRAQGYQGVTTLFGGLDGWKEDVVFPVAPANPTPGQAAQFERALQVARFFGGKGRAASEGGSAMSLTIQAPASPKAAAPGATVAKPGTTVRKKKEGC